MIRFFASLTALLCAALFAAGGCGEEAKKATLLLIETPGVPGNGGDNPLLEAGVRQLEKELSMRVIEEEWPGGDITGALGARVDTGVDLALVLGRGDIILDQASLDEGLKLVGLGVALRDVGGRALGESEGVAAVRYKAEEGAYLSGILAASLTATRGVAGVNPEAVVGYIGCPASAQEKAWRLGFERGVADVNPDCAVAEFDLASPDDLANARSAVDAALKLKADIFFCAPGPYQREVLALAGARGFLVITADPEPTEAEPEALLARTVLRDDLAMFRAARLFSGDGGGYGDLEWGRQEGVVDFSLASRFTGLLPLSVLQALDRQVPADLQAH